MSTCLMKTDKSVNCKDYLVTADCRVSPACSHEILLLKNAVNALTQTRHSAAQRAGFPEKITFSIVKAEKCYFSVCLLHLSHDVTAASQMQGTKNWNVNLIFIIGRKIAISK